MQQFMNENPFLVFRGQAVEFFGNNFQTVTRFFRQRLLPDGRQAPDPGCCPAGGTLAAETEDSGRIGIIKRQVDDQMGDPAANVRSQKPFHTATSITGQANYWRTG